MPCGPFSPREAPRSAGCRVPSGCDTAPSVRLHPVILAGGRGERFWPLSRRSRPKQLLPLLSGRSMLADTIARLEGISSARDTFVVTARDLTGAVRDAVPQLPHHHIVGEPVGKNTAPAIALAAW